MFLEGADHVGGQLHGDKEGPFSGVTKIWQSLEEGARKRCSECGWHAVGATLGLSEVQMRIYSLYSTFWNSFRNNCVVCFHVPSVIFHSCHALFQVNKTNQWATICHYCHALFQVNKTYRWVMCLWLQLIKCDSRIYDLCCCFLNSFFLLLKPTSCAYFVFPACCLM